eukprot:gene15218-8352_t
MRRRRLPPVIAALAAPTNAHITTVCVATSPRDPGRATLFVGTYDHGSGLDPASGTVHVGAAVGAFGPACAACPSHSSCGPGAGRPEACPTRNVTGCSRARYPPHAERGFDLSAGVGGVAESVRQCAAADGGGRRMFRNDSTVVCFESHPDAALPWSPQYRHGVEVRMGIGAGPELWQRSIYNSSLHCLGDRGTSRIAVWYGAVIDV